MFKNFGLIALIIKISPAVLKLIKSAKFIKVSLAGGSMWLILIYLLGNLL